LRRRSSGSQQRCLCRTDDQGAPGHRECATYRLRALQVRKVTWHLPLELGEIARDGCHVEASEDRFLSPDDESIQLAIEANDAFIERLEAIRDRAQTLTIE
jgi:hypothetical protein